MSDKPKQLTDEMAVEEWQKIALQVVPLTEHMQDGQYFIVAPGSQLADDDALTHPYRLSHCARKCINTGIDHMHALITLILEVPIIHSQSDYTLIRSALENFAVAFWVLHPSSQLERITRALQWYVKDYRDGDQALRSLNLPERAPLKTHLTDIRQIGMAAGCKKADILRDYGSTAVLKYADQNTLIRPKPLLMWQLCSGFAHGRNWANMAINEVEIKPTDEAGLKSVKFTSDFKRLLAGGFPTAQLMNEVVRLFTEGAKAP